MRMESYLQVTVEEVAETSLREIIECPSEASNGMAADEILELIDRLDFAYWRCQGLGVDAYIEVLHLPDGDTVSSDTRLSLQTIYLAKKNRLEAEHAVAATSHDRMYRAGDNGIMRAYRAHFNRVFAGGE